MTDGGRLAGGRSAAKACPTIVSNRATKTAVRFIECPDFPARQRAGPELAPRTTRLPNRSKTPAHFPQTIKDNELRREPANSRAR